MTTTPEIKMINASLCEREDEIIALGWLDLEGLGHLKVADYQREEITKGAGRKTKIQLALERGVSLPTITLGMRGQKFESKGSTIILQGATYIVDGLQRTFAFKQWAMANPEAAATGLLSAEVRFNTTRDSEEVLFHEMNLHRTSMSPNVILRNMRKKNDALMQVYGLSVSDSSSVIFNRVQWNQSMRVGELFSAATVCRVIIDLHRGHAKVAPGHKVTTIGNNFDLIIEVTGVPKFRENVANFMQIIDDVWGIHDVQYKNLATHLRGNFLLAIARIFADHEDFWKGSKLVITSDIKAKLRGFAIADPNVIQLAGAGTMAVPILHNLILTHINKGRRNKLVPRRPLEQDAQVTRKANSAHRDDGENTTIESVVLGAMMGGQVYARRDLEAALQDAGYARGSIDMAMLTLAKESKVERVKQGHYRRLMP